MRKTIIQIMVALCCSGVLANTPSATPSAATAATPTSAPVPASQIKPQLRQMPAERLAVATNVKILAASRAGSRIVAVGDFGAVLLSDDEGAHYRQARAVPVSSTLTAVVFADANTGWAVGHWGAILKTVDGGETWVAQRSNIERDQPLFSVHFKNANEGWAVGLWSLMLHTTDGGATWQEQKLPVPPGAKKADRNLFAMFADAKGVLYITSEQGRVLRSQDGGANWQYRETGYAGSLWSGVALASGNLLVGGLRGSLYRSTDGGESWQAVGSGVKNSLTAMLQGLDKKVLAVGLDGLLLQSEDDGASFRASQRPDRAALTALLDGKAGPLLFSTRGPLAK
jgi:photosystem II stability/assembly factor-like uncharacterized protein